LGFIRFREVPKERRFRNCGSALCQNLQRLRGIWEECQSSRDRNAIYAYLSAV
jgi:hypothetical protein